MRVEHAALSVLVTASLVTAAGPAGAAAAGLEWVSVDSSGADLPGLHRHASISADGRFVAFEPGFVRDRLTGTTVQVNFDSAGNEVVASRPQLSADGQYVAFATSANGSAASDNLIYVRNLRTGTSTLANVRAEGTPANHLLGSIRFSMSGNGRYVAFSSEETGVVAGDTNKSTDVFVRDLQTGTTTRASVRPDGSPTSANSFVGYYGQALSDDGRFVVFSSLDTQLVSGDTNATGDVFVRDLQTGTTSRVSLGNGGVQGDGASGTQVTGALSGDGRTVMFGSRANNLVEGDEDPGTDLSYPDLFVRDLEAGTTTRVAASTEDYSIHSGALSADGRYAVYGTLGTGQDDVYLYDLRTGTATTVNVPAAGGDPVGYSYYPAVSANGDVAFQSEAAGLADGDTGRSSDIFVAPH